MTIDIVLTPFSVMTTIGTVFAAATLLMAVWFYIKDRRRAKTSSSWVGLAVDSFAGVFQLVFCAVPFLISVVSFFAAAVIKLLE